MKLRPPAPGRRSIRLKGFDYTRPGAYFVTLCTHNRQCLFGDFVIVDGEVQLNERGGIVTACWNNIPHHFSNITIDAFIVMPNHVHGIIIINDAAVGAKHSLNSANASPLPPTGTQPGSLAAIVQNYKSVSTRKINAVRSAPGHPVWQRNYYEHIIRTDSDLARIRRYIANNPLQWTQDRLNPSLKQR